MMRCPQIRKRNSLRRLNQKSGKNAEAFLKNSDLINSIRP